MRVQKCGAVPQPSSLTPDRKKGSDAYGISLLLLPVLVGFCQLNTSLDTSGKRGNLN